MSNIQYTGCCIHITNVELDSSTNKFTFTLSNGNSIVTDAINVSTTTTNTFVTAGSVAGTTLTLNRNDGNNVVIDASSLQNTYTAGDGVDISGNVISATPLADVGGGRSLINTTLEYVLKTITSSDESIVIDDDGSLLDFSSKKPEQHTIPIDNITTTFLTKSTYYRNAIGVVNSVIVLPSVTTVPFGIEYHIFAGSDIDINTTSAANEIVSTITAPHNYSSGSYVNTLSVKAGEYYIIRKYSTAAYIISKQ